MLHAFGERGVDALPYKGPVLAEMAYGDLALRRSIDVDVLVRRRDVQPARETLVALGYALSEECCLHEQAYAHAHHHLVFKNMQNGVTLELHWQTVTPQFSFDLSFDALWKNSIMTSLACQTVRSPSVEDTLLLVCVHASMHGWKQLKQVCDVAELLRRYPSANWGALQRRAQALGALRMLRLGVLLAHEALDAPLPAALAVADDAVAQQLCREIMNQLTSDTVAIGEADQRSFPGYHARLRERRRERVSEALRRVFIPNMDDWRALALPDSLVFLHYVLRPLRLARRGLASFLRMRRRAA
jgi:hypothetical protein